MKIDRVEAERRALELTPAKYFGGAIDFVERLKFRKGIAEAILQARNDTAEECAEIAERFDQVDCAATLIRAAYGIKGE